MVNLPQALSLATLVLAVLVPSVSQAQPRAPTAANATLNTRTVASPLLPPHHWAVRAAERVHALGLAPDFLPGQRAVRLAEVEQTLANAALDAPPSLRPQVMAWHRRFLSELVRFREGDRTLDALAGLQLVGGDDLPDDLSLRIASEARFSSRFLAAAFDASTSARLWAPDAALNTWELATQLGPLSLSVGKQPVGWASHQGTGLLFSGRAPIHRVELQTTRGFRVPGLRFLGAFSAHAFYGFLSEPRHGPDARLFGTALQWQPHPRITVAVQRATMLGAEGTEQLGLVDTLRMIALERNGDENNLVSGVFRVRLPTESLVPLTLYGEWGTEDMAGNHLYTPGLVGGLWVPAVPGLPSLALGFEATHIGHITRRTVVWYAHFRQRGGWYTGDVPLGHPMGGNGRELRLYGTLLAGDRVYLDAAAFRRTRYSSHVRAATRGGIAYGGELRFNVRASDSTELRLETRLERGRSWTEHHTALTALLHF